MTTTIRFAAAVAVVFLSVTAAHAADPAVKCLSAKIKEAGKYNACRMNAEAKSVKKGESPSYSKCDAKFSDKWGKIEDKGDVACPTSGDVAEIAGKEFGNTDAVRAALSGDPFYAHEHGLYVTDTQTNLMWVTLVDCGGPAADCTAAAGSCTAPLCVQNRYDWSASGEDPDGLAFTKYLEQLNGNLPSFQETREGGVTPLEANCYAGLCDWRLPTREELLTILDCGFGPPCIDPIFGPTASSFYWSASTVDFGPGNAWGVEFGFGNSNFGNKGFDSQVRAVRGGS
jgi:hypothetical protein